MSAVTAFSLTKIVVNIIQTHTRREPSLISWTLRGFPTSAASPPRFTMLPVARRARSLRIEENDAHGMDAVSRRRHCPRDNYADGGRTTGDGRNRTASLT
jgi:hypothetical protein